MAKVTEEMIGLLDDVATQVTQLVKQLKESPKSEKGQRDMLMMCANKIRSVVDNAEYWKTEDTA